MRGDRLRECRLRYGDTQQDLAEFLGVTVNAVANWENERRDPKPMELSRAAKRYGVSVDYLLGLTDHPSRYEDLPPGWEQVIAEAARHRVGPDEVAVLIRHIGDMLAKQREHRG